MILGSGVSVYCSSCLWLFLSLSFTTCLNINGQPVHVFILWIFSCSDFKYGSLLLFRIIPMSALSMALSCFHLHAHFFHCYFWIPVFQLKKNFFFKYRVLFSGCFPVLINKSSLLLWFNLSIFPICTFNVYDSISLSICALNCFLNLFLFYENVLSFLVAFWWNCFSVFNGLLSWHSINLNQNKTPEPKFLVLNAKP